MTLPAAASAQRRFRYHAVDAAGRTVAGTLDAADERGASDALSARGLWALEVRPASRWLERRSAPAARDVALGLRGLATLLDASIPLGRALAAFEDIAPDRWRAHVPGLREAVRRGEPLAAALAQSPLALPPVLLGLVRAGEGGGDLAGGVRRAAALADDVAATREALRSALAYPVVLAVAGTGSLVLLVGVVIPRFATILDGLGQTLPPATALILAAARHAKLALVLGTIVLALLALAWRAWVSTPAGQAAWHGLLLRVPVVGAVRFSAGTARTGSVVSALLETGMPLPRALTLAADAAGDAELRRRLLAAREGVLHGRGFAAAASSAGALTPPALKLLRAGEEAGRVAEMLGHSARIEGARAAATVRRAVRVLEPTLILLFGGLVALVAAALLQAVYALRPTG